MFTDDDKLKILEKLGYKIESYSVAERLRASGYNAMVRNQYGYEVIKNGKVIGSLDEVFKKELTARIFGIDLS